MRFQASELRWLLDHLHENFASLKDGLEECIALLLPQEPGSTLALSSVRSESIKGYVTRVGAWIVKGVSERLDQATILIFLCIWLSLSICAPLLLPQTGHPTTFTISPPTAEPCVLPDSHPRAFPHSSAVANPRRPG